MQIHVADAIGVRHHRNAGVAAHVANEGRRAARDDHFHQVVHAEQKVDLSARFQQHHRRRVDAVLGQHRVRHRAQGAIALGRLPAALQRDRVAALPRQAGDLYKSVGPGLENHPQHAQRRAHAFQD